MVEDEMPFRLEIRDLLETEDYAVVEAGNADEALERLHDGVVSVATEVAHAGADGRTGARTRDRSSPV